MTTSTGAGPGLAGINHIMVLMLGNRSFDHMLGYLYADTGNVSPSGQPFEGLTGSMRGFIKDFAYTITWETSEKWSIVPGTTASWIMGCFTPQAPLDHTSVLKTIEQRWNPRPLTARAAAALGFGDVLMLAAPRTDDILAGVTVPVSGSAGPSAGQVSRPEAIREELTARYAAGPRPAATAAGIVQDPDMRPS